LEREIILTKKNNLPDLKLTIIAFLTETKGNKYGSELYRYFVSPSHISFFISESIDKWLPLIDKNLRNGSHT